MNNKDNFINIEVMQKGMEDTLNPPPDIASLIFENLKKVQPKEGLNQKI